MTTNTSFYHAAGKKVIETTYHFQGLEDSDSDDGESISLTTSKHWKNAILEAKRAKENFDLYPWEDNPRDLNGNEATRRAEWLARQQGYPFDHFSEFCPEGYIYNLSPSNSIQLLYLCHKVKNNEPFDEREFYNELGDVRALRAQVQCECCSCVLF